MLSARSFLFLIVSSGCAALGACSNDTAPPNVPVPSADASDFVDASAADVSTDAPTAPSLPEGVHALQSLDPTTNDDDLAPFDEAVGTTTFVGLGESVHTSGGFHRIRARLVRHMIEKLGFRAVALETPWRTAEIATRYVERCEGSQRAATQSIFRVFASVQMADLFDWLCSWNTAHPDDRVSFWGFDVQDPWANGAHFKAFVSRAAPENAAIATGLEACSGVRFSSAEEYYSNPDAMAIEEGKKLIATEEFDKCTAAVTAAKSWLDEHTSELAAATSAAEVEWAKLDVDGIDANEKKIYWLFRNYNQGYEARDQGMARALLKIRELRSPGKRVAVIAHNGHLSYAQSKVNTKDMGEILKQDYKIDYAAFGLLAYALHINWAFEDPPVPKKKDSAEVILHGLGVPSLFVDLQRTKLFEEGKTYEILTERLVPREQFRGLVYLDESEAMEYSR